MIKPIEKQRVADEIVEQLRSLILTGEYTPGSKLPPERELAKQLGVNRASLREALKKLEHLGLVRIRQGDGTRIENFMETAGIELIAHLIPIAAGANPDIIRDVLEFRQIFGCEVARLAAERAGAEELERMREIAEKAKASELGADELLQLDFDFYVVLAQAARNRVMALLINTVRNAVHSYAPLMVHLNGPAEEVLEQHRALIAAIEARDPVAAAAAAEAHLRAGTSRVGELMVSSAAADETE
jgi:GntR family transcriptional regulator, transcriptional repressor for pyruvate dehydrogenase complex